MVECHVLRTGIVNNEIGPKILLCEFFVTPRGAQ